jgi:VWFA-related protein
LAVVSIAQEGPVIRTTTRLVQVSVIVRDKNGPVEGLKKEDFQIFDHGKEQKIAVFTVASTKAAAAAMAKLPPGIYTNRPERGGEPIGSVTVVLIDLLNTRFQDQAYARTQMMNFLKTLDPQDRVALYLLGNGVKILHDFTQDPERLVRAVAKMRGEVPRELAAADEAPSRYWRRRTGRDPEPGSRTDAGFLHRQSREDDPERYGSDREPSRAPAWAQEPGLGLGEFSVLDRNRRQHHGSVARASHFQ